MENKTRPPKSKKILKTTFLIVPLIGFILFILFLVCFLLSSLHITEDQPIRDARRIAEIKYIKEVMEVYFNEHDSKYFQSSTTPISISGTVIPKDPKGGSYGWLDNVSEPQKFCIWAKFERKSGYVIASHCGYKETSQQPISLNKCCSLSKP